MDHIYLHRGNYPQAIAYYKKSYRTRAGKYLRQYDCDLAYIKNNQFQEAINHFTNALSLNSNQPDYHYALATTYVHTARREHKLALAHYLCQLEKCQP
ncbi:tetratricopeptide repeat protein [Candidatus Coxiella mudrowiae]|uniref:tetratricopeptide repeat protein n=1 Tax=Candidatus Coxiella mudrowiae TaxID=2054173 RepID=UPI001F1DCC52|nr:tetratricopeptide repeat protein [Candidatus Coxiella mudrowiae]